MFPFFAVEFHISSLHTIFPSHFLPMLISTVSQLSLLVLCTHPTGELSRLGRSSLREAGKGGFSSREHRGEHRIQMANAKQMDNNWIQHGRTNLESHLGPPKMKAGEQALPRQEQIAMALTFCFISLHFMAWRPWRHGLSAIQVTPPPVQRRPANPARAESPECPGHQIRASRFVRSAKSAETSGGSGLDDQQRLLCRRRRHGHWIDMGVRKC